MYKISDFSKRVGISIQTLRYYDKISLLKPSYTNNFTGYRYYTDDQINKIKIINYLKEIDLSLEEIDLYLKTNDINIIENKKNKFKEKMNLINDFLKNGVNSMYKIYESDYKKYLEMNGLKREKTPQALELRDNNARYFIIEKDNEFYNDVYIYNKDNWLCVDNNILLDEEVRKKMFNYLKNHYEELMIYVDFKNEKFYNQVKNISENIKEEVVTKKDIEGKEFQIYKIIFSL